MKIALICTPKDVHVRKWAAALNVAGAEVILFCPEPDFENIPGLKVITVSGRKKNIWTYPDFWFSAPTLKKLLQEEAPDIVNALHITPFGVWARLAGYKPLILMALGADILEYTEKISDYKRWAAEESRSGIRNFISRKWHTWQVQKSLRFADYIFSDNQAIQNGVLKLSPSAGSKSSVFTWGINLSLFNLPSPETQNTLREKYNIPEGKIVILCPRGLKPVYQPELILDTIEYAHQVGNTEFVWLLLKGPYDVPPDIHQRIIHSAIQENVIYLETFLADSDISEIWQLSDILVSIPVYDGLSASVLQGFATGLLPVLSDISASVDLSNQGYEIHIAQSATAENLWRNIVSWYSEFTEEDRTNIRVKNRINAELYADLEKNTRTFIEITNSKYVGK